MAPIAGARPRRTSDVALAAGIALALAAGALWVGPLVGESVFGTGREWYGSPGGALARAAAPITWRLASRLGLSYARAAQVLLVTSLEAMLLVLYAALRAARWRPIDAALAALAAGVSSAGLRLWLSMPIGDAVLARLAPTGGPVWSAARRTAALVLVPSLTVGWNARYPDWPLLVPSGVIARDPLRAAAALGWVVLAVSAILALRRRTPAARWLRVLAVAVLALTCGLNAAELVRVRRKARARPTERARVEAERARRPEDPWPRGRGHVVLGWPGTPDGEKAYHEPGGGFSPAPGSFGVALWWTGADGRLQTSDTLPEDAVRQRLLPFVTGACGVRTETSAYSAVWSSPQRSKWRLEVTGAPGASAVIRSVGPAGGPLHRLAWADGRLVVEDRWEIAMTPAPTVALGREGTPGWRDDTTPRTDVDDAAGWAYARLRSPAARWELSVRDRAAPAPAAPASAPPSSLQLDLPSAEFADSLFAQVAHLRMGLVDGATRPGDPTNYPQPWLRDGAHVLAALAAAGDQDEARGLAPAIAEKDFFGGFGPEADGPGLALWALEELAARLRDPAFDRWLWPHARRKAEWIARMLEARGPLRVAVDYPLLPDVRADPDRDLVAEPAADGLIVGRMDGHRPILYVNAASYGGLRQAARLATRLGQAALAREWTARAEELRLAWERALPGPASANRRTFVFSLWPSGTAAGQRDLYARLLEDRWRGRFDAREGFRQTPAWTYFELAEAHQWLALGRPERAWDVVRWFWAHQASAGLYTWWEGSGEENASGRWQWIRGWTHPPHVTPHYWTAAEMLLLQLDMLAALSDDDALVIGPGVPVEWISSRLAVRGLSLPRRAVDWTWDGRTVEVTLHGAPPARIVLGPAFPRAAPVTVRTLSASGS